MQERRHDERGERAVEAHGEPAKVPASSLTWKARAVPMPWLATPTAKPRAAKSRMPSALNSGVTEDRAENAGEDDEHGGERGDAAEFAVIAIAIGGGHGFAASETSKSRGAPSSQAMRRPRPIAVSERRPRAAADIGRAMRRTVREVVAERDRQRDGGGAEQEVHELRALEIGAVDRCRSARAGSRSGRRRSAPGWRADPDRLLRNRKSPIAKATNVSVSHRSGLSLRGRPMMPQVIGIGAALRRLRGAGPAR